MKKNLPTQSIAALFGLVFVFALGNLPIACSQEGGSREPDQEKTFTWEAFASPSGGFQVELPGKRMEQSRKFKPTPDSEIEMKMFLVNEVESQVVFVVAFHDLAAKPNTDAEIREVLNGGMQGALVNVNGKLGQQEDITVHDFPARHFTFTGRQGSREIHGTFRIVLRENRIYQLSVMRIAATKLPADAASRFFDSLEFTDIIPDEPKSEDVDDDKESTGEEDDGDDNDDSTGAKRN